MQQTIFYPGSFDPITNGHMDVISRACRLASRLVIGIGTQHSKSPLFAIDERLEMIRAETAALANQLDCQIDVVLFSGLTVDAAKANNANVIVRGLRNASDFDYELQMAGMNATLSADVQTIFLPASPGVGHISSSLVRQIAAMGGDVTRFVPPWVAQLLSANYAD